MNVWDKVETILMIVASLGIILYSITAWHTASGMDLWNWTHSLTFTILPALGFAILIGIYKRLTEDE